MEEENQSFSSLDEKGVKPKIIPFPENMAGPNNIILQEFKFYQENNFRPNQQFAEILIEVNDEDISNNYKNLIDKNNAIIIIDQKRLHENENGFINQPKISNVTTNEYRSIKMNTDSNKIPEKNNFQIMSPTIPNQESLINKKTVENGQNLINRQILPPNPNVQINPNLPENKFMICPFEKKFQLPLAHYNIISIYNEFIENYIRFCSSSGISTPRKIEVSRKFQYLEAFMKLFIEVFNFLNLCVFWIFFRIADLIKPDISFRDTLIWMLLRFILFWVFLLVFTAGFNFYPFAIFITILFVHALITLAFLIFLFVVYYPNNDINIFGKIAIIKENDPNFQHFMRQKPLAGILGKLGICAEFTAQVT